ncbi:unnamed protein product [Microthlaspi erraticum]|uniref:Uncharacterized protein n=1 Tax=Microthlaspi erraticum TaxID=1685480 RepID=A0A6D2IKT7_9BRAS|nr:unnamed protein product [Microthlaspi erraticum]
MNGCPIPDGVDPRLVRQRKESKLNRSDSYRPSPLTITTIGDLTRFSPDKLRELSSTGIDFRVFDSATLLSFSETDIKTHLHNCTPCNATPATIMLITGPGKLEGLAETIYHLYDRKDYRTILVYPQRDEAAPDWLWESFLRRVSRQWLWKSLLEDEIDSGNSDDEKERTNLVLQDNNCSEMGESRWSCSLCPSVALQSVEDLAEHLKSHVNNNKRKEDEEVDPE